MIIKIKGSETIRFKTTATSLKEVAKPDEHPMVFTKSEVKRVFRLLKTKQQVEATAKCGGIDSFDNPCGSNHYNTVEKNR